jgi:hypothetical protein
LAIEGVDDQEQLHPRVRRRRHRPGHREELRGKRKKTIRIASELGRGPKISVMMPMVPPSPKSVQISPPMMPEPDRF